MVTDMKREFVWGRDSAEDYKVVIVTGTSRAGKTLLARTLATFENVEWIEEPYSLLTLPVECGMGMLDKIDASRWIRAICKEMFIDCVLLRNANFRPDDQSTIWNFKDASEIFHRLKVLGSRADVARHIEEKKTVFVLGLPDIFPFLDLFQAAFPQLKVVHVIRDGRKVADAVAGKQWLSDENLKHPQRNSCFYHTDQFPDLYFPWWIPEEDTEKFVGYTDYERALYYWSQILLYNSFAEKEKETDNYQILKYEELVHNIEHVVCRMESYIGKKRTAKTSDWIERIDPELDQYNNANVKAVRDPLLLDQFKKVMSQYQY